MFEGLFQLMRGWTPLGQGLFLLIVLGAVLALFQKMAYYIVVAFRGWPPEHVTRQELAEEAED